MTDQYGADSTVPSLNLHSLLPSVNQSESANSIISTLFQRWVTKPEISNVAGTIAAYSNAGVGSVSEPISTRQNQQLQPVVVIQRGEEQLIFDHTDILRKLEFLGVDISKYSIWGQSQYLKFLPPISFDKLLNWVDYYWVDYSLADSPDYIVMVPTADTPWGRQNKWKHKDQLSSFDYPYATQAVLPIIEYDDLELSEWIVVNRVWQKYSEVVGDYVVVDIQPTMTEITSSNFTQQWRLVTDSESFSAAPSYQYTTQLTTYTDPANLPEYLLGTNSVRVWIVNQLTNETVRVYNFVEATTASIELIDSIPLGWDLHIQVGASVDAELRLHRVLVTMDTGTQQLVNLTTKRYVGQYKLERNQYPAFNLYDTLGQFISTGFVWKYQQIDTATWDLVLQQRVVSDSVTEDFTFETDMVSSVGNLRAVKRLGELTTLWGDRQISTPSYSVIDGEVVWDVPDWIGSNPLRVTNTVHKLSELAPHIIAVGTGGSTIRLGVDSCNILVASTVASNLSFPTLIDFITARREEITHTYLTKCVDMLFNTINTSIFAHPTELASIIFNQITTQLKYQTAQNSAYLELMSYNAETNVGIPNTTLSFGQMGLVNVVEPAQPTFVSGSWVVPSHERVFGSTVNHVISLSPIQRRTIERAIGQLSYVQSNNTSPIPLSSRAIWKETTTGRVYKFAADVYDVNAPQSPTVGSSWFNYSTNIAYRKTTIGWDIIDTAVLWELIDFHGIIASVVSLMEWSYYKRALEISPPSSIATTYQNMWELDIGECQSEYSRRVEVGGTVSNEIRGEGVYLTSLFVTNPVKFLDALVLSYCTTVGELQVNPATERPVASTDLVSTTNYPIASLLRSVTASIRYSNVDSSFTSTLSEWVNWTTMLAYQTGSLVVPETLNLSSDCVEVNDFSVVLKRVQNYKAVEFTNLLISLNTAGSTVNLVKNGGSDWSFTISSSCPSRFDKVRYGVLSQHCVWDSVIQVFVSVEPIVFESGQSVTLSGAELFIRVVDNTKFQLCETSADVSGDPTAYVNFDSLHGITQIIRQIDSTFSVPRQAGVINWSRTTVDRNNPITFDFPVVVTGIQSLIDFVVGYSEYMIDAGVVVNGGDFPATTITGEFINWQQQLTLSLTKLYDSVGLSRRSYSEVGRVTSYTTLDPLVIELNPFTRVVGIYTPVGVVTNIFDSPYEGESISVPAIYDENGDSITQHITPLRTDRVTSIYFEPPASANESTSDPLKLPRICSGKCFVDWYEHVILFEQSTIDGVVLFDRFYSLCKQSLNIEFQRATTHYGRPSMSGFVVTKSGVLPNFETIADYQRNSVDPTLSNEQISFTKGVRAGYGKEQLKFFENIPVTQKTEFQFWQRMIRMKGTTDAINQFGKHQIYSDFDVDEYWAWKLGEFGATQSSSVYELQLSSGYTQNNVTTLSLNSVYPIAVATGYPVVHAPPTDATSWWDYPTFLNTLGIQSHVTFGSCKTVVQKIINLSTMYQVILPPQLVLSIPDSNIEFVFGVIDVVSTTQVTLTDYSVDTKLHISLQDGESAAAFIVGTYVGDVSISGLISVPTTFAIGSVLTVIKYRTKSAVHSATRVATATELIGYTVFDPTRVYVSEGYVDNTLSMHVMFEVLNDSVAIVISTELPTVDLIVTLISNTPNYAVLSPARVVDNVTNSIESRYPVWDPKRGVHTTAVTQISVQSDNSPAVFGTTELPNNINGLWGEYQLGCYWLDTTKLWYKPYADTNRTGFDAGSENWGQLYDDIQPIVYQWVESNTRPVWSTATQSKYPYSRIVTKTRPSVNILTTDNTLEYTVFRVAVNPYTNGDVVALYSNSTVQLIGAATAVEYMVANATSNSFSLTTATTYNATPILLSSYSTGIESLYCAGTDWDSYEWDELQVETDRFFVGISGTRDFQLTNPRITNRTDVAQYISVWVNGIRAAFSYDEATHVLNVMDSTTGTPVVVELTHVDELLVVCEPPDSTVSTPPSVDTLLNTVVYRDIPYTKIISTVNQVSTVKFYYWERGSSIIGSTKTLTTSDVEQGLIAPGNNRYMCIREYNYNTAEFDIIQLHGMSSITRPTQKRLCFEFNSNIRSVLTDTTRHVPHECWTLIRERGAVVHKSVWKAIAQAVVGVDLLVYENTNGGTINLLPSSVRVVYDYIHDTSSRYGSNSGQVLLPKHDIQQLLIGTFTDTSVVSQTIVELVLTTDFSDVAAVLQLLDLIYTKVPSTVVNKFAFTVFKLGLFAGYVYDALLKTSYIALNANQQVSLEALT